MKKYLIFILFISIGLISCKKISSDQQLQVNVVDKFYKIILIFKEGGIPSKYNIERLSPLISQSFRTNLLEALAAEERHYNHTKGFEPSLVEGSLFYSLFEGADRIKTINPDREFGQNAYLIKLEYGDPNKKNQFVQWQDRPVLIKEGNQWVIDDLIFLVIGNLVPKEGFRKFFTGLLLLTTKRSRMID